MNISVFFSLFSNKLGASVQAEETKGQFFCYVGTSETEHSTSSRFIPSGVVRENGALTLRF